MILQPQFLRGSHFGWLATLRYVPAYVRTTERSYSAEFETLKQWRPHGRKRTPRLATFLLLYRAKTGPKTGNDQLAPSTKKDLAAWAKSLEK